MNFIFGASGFAKEVYWLVAEIYASGGENYCPDYFVVEDESQLVGTRLNSRPVISESDFFCQYAHKDNNCFIAIGDPRIRSKITEKIKKGAPNSLFPNLVHPNVSYDKGPGKVIMGEGVIVCSGAVLTTDIVIGDFVQVHVRCTIGHDTIIHQNSTILPGGCISGNVNVGSNVLIGAGAIIIDKVRICSNTIIGAGAIVINDIEEPGTYVGNPARRVK